MCHRPFTSRRENRTAHIHAHSAFANIFGREDFNMLQLPKKLAEGNHIGRHVKTIE